MKSYLQGMITGGALVFAIMVFMGASGKNPAGKYQFEIKGDSGIMLLDTQTGTVYLNYGDNWNEKPYVTFE